jgi:hypothetical protein
VRFRTASVLFAIVFVNCSGFAQTEAPFARPPHSDVTMAMVGSFIPHTEGRLVSGPIATGKVEAGLVQTGISWSFGRRWPW